MKQCSNDNSNQFPLKGYRIMDFGMVLAGGLATANLADMGAEVIKIESMHRLDTMRTGRPLVGEMLDPDQQPLHHNVNRGKLSFTVNFKSNKGQELLQRLAAISDAVVENMSPGTLTRVNLDYETLKVFKPDLVMISFSAAGQYGPYNNLIGYGPTMSALSGMDSIAGYYNEPVLGMHTPWPDMHSALSTSFCLLTALRLRNRLGIGQHIDISQWEASTSILGPLILDYQMNGRQWRPTGNHSWNMAPHGIYACSGEDAWVAIAIETEEQWKSFCSLINVNLLPEDSRFSDLFSRIAHKTELDAIVTEWTSDQEPWTVAMRLQNQDIPAAPCMRLKDRLNDPHFEARDIFLNIDHPILGKEIISGIPWKLSQSSGGVINRSPLMGEHIQYVAGDLLGLSKREIRSLKSQEVLH